MKCLGKCLSLVTSSYNYWLCIEGWDKGFLAFEILKVLKYAVRVNMLLGQGR